MEAFGAAAVLLMVNRAVASVVLNAPRLPVFTALSSLSPPALNLSLGKW